jgi:hypothetical protein
MSLRTISFGQFHSDNFIRTISLWQFHSDNFIRTISFGQYIRTISFGQFHSDNAFGQFHSDNFIRTMHSDNFIRTISFGQFHSDNFIQTKTYSPQNLYKKSCSWLWKGSIGSNFFSKQAEDDWILNQPENWIRLMLHMCLSFGRIQFLLLFGGISTN